MAQYDPKHAAHGERRNVSASLLISSAFLCVLLTLSTANPLLTLLLEACAALALVLLRPALRGLRHLPYFFVLSQYIYRTTEPEPRISLRDQREMRRLLRQVQDGRLEL